MVDRKELKRALVDALKNYTSFKMLSPEEEINPCHVSFENAEFFIYVKNLSPAQLSNNNPDIWRIQLPIRDDFESIKKSNALFIVLGFDEENQIYTTWNPYWVKQRLNVAKSISLYSRLTLQQKTKELGTFQQLNLNNDGLVISFPCERLGEYLTNIFHFFPEETEYVAMGSRKRATANNAYRILCDRKNISALAYRLSSMGYSSFDVHNFCEVIDKLISEGYFSRNRKTFLACDALPEYIEKIEEFSNIFEVRELEKGLDCKVSDALFQYVQCLLEMDDLIEDADILINEDEQSVSDDFPCTEETIPDGQIDWEKLYTASNGKLTCIANPELLKLLRPCLDTEYRKLSTAYNVVSDFYKDRFANTMELKDWNTLFNRINWDNPQTVPDHEPPQGSKSKPISLRVTTPDGQCIFEKRVCDTFVSVIKYAGVQKVREMNIIICKNNMVVEQQDINPRYESQMKYADEGLYVNTCCDTATKGRIIRQISDKLELGLIVEYVSSEGYANDFPQPVFSSSRQKIKVRFFDGKEICKPAVVDTFVETIHYIGAEKIQNLNIIVNRDNLILPKEMVNPIYKRAMRLVENNLYVNTNSSTSRKYDILNEISKRLKIEMTVEIL